MDLILANKDFTPAGIFNTDAITIDLEIGKDNDFELTTYRQDRESYIWMIHNVVGGSAQTELAGDMLNGSLVYVPGTEYGGFIGEMDTDTSVETITYKGRTFRGFLAYKVIEPETGNDYYTISGDLNTILAALIDKCGLDGWYKAATETTVTVNNYQFPRFCTFLEGVTDLFDTVNYRLNIEYNEPAEMYGGSPITLSAQPIKNYSNDIELSQNSSLNFTLARTYQGVNHLICLGQGELQNRTRIDLYATTNGTISTTQDAQYTGINEIVQVYDYANAENKSTLKYNGKKKLAGLMSQAAFEMDVESLDIDVALGDIISARDYLTGVYVEHPITKKVLRVDSGKLSIEYSIETDEVEESE